jgi:SMODS and SLOG-associating 2TM effector domain 3/SMODS and SLOG-associating 2TM effector domain 1
MASTISTVTLSDAELPLLFQQADKAAIHAQRRFFRSLGTELLLLLVGSLVNLFTFLPFTTEPFTVLGLHVRPLPLAELAAAGLIALALAVRLYRYGAHLDTRWYEARAVAESVKSLSWRYAVGGDLFEVAKPAADVDGLFRRRLQDTLADLSRPVYGVGYSEDGQITNGLRQLRARNLPERRQAYLERRVTDQQGWYERKQAWNRRRARFAQGISIFLEALSILLAVAQAIGLLTINLQTIATAILAGGIAWSQAHRYQDLSATYDVAAKEARSMMGLLPTGSDEGAWADFVEHAETAFSREHRLWFATRGD